VPEVKFTITIFTDAQNVEVRSGLYLLATSIDTLSNRVPFYININKSIDFLFTNGFFSHQGSRRAARFTLSSRTLMLNFTAIFLKLDSSLFIQLGLILLFSLFFLKEFYHFLSSSLSDEVLRLS
jgi:hypothetical protein